MLLAVIQYNVSKHPLLRMVSAVSQRARQRMFQFFMETAQITSETRVLDVGVTPDRSLPEFNFFEQLYPYKNRITATSIEDAAFLEEQYPGLRFVQTKGNILPFEDGEFDVVFCSAVVEHVGDRQSQAQFIGELLRVSRRFFITTPNRQFPIELHTFLPLVHWLPQPVHQAVLRKIGLEFWSHTENLNLLTPSAFKQSFPDEAQVKFHSYRLLGLPSNLIAYGNSPNIVAPVGVNPQAGGQ